MAQFKISIDFEADAPVPLRLSNGVFFVEEFMRNEIMDKLLFYPFENIQVEVCDQVTGNKFSAEMRKRRKD